MCSPASTDSIISRTVSCLPRNRFSSVWPSPAAAGRGRRRRACLQCPVKREQRRGRAVLSGRRFGWGRPGGRGRRGGVELHEGRHAPRPRRNTASHAIGCEGMNGPAPCVPPARGPPAARVDDIASSSASSRGGSAAAAPPRGSHSARPQAGLHAHTAARRMAACRGRWRAAGSTRRRGPGRSARGSRGQSAARATPSRSADSSSSPGASRAARSNLDEADALLPSLTRRIFGATSEAGGATPRVRVARPEGDVRVDAAHLPEAPEHPWRSATVGARVERPGPLEEGHAPLPRLAAQRRLPRDVRVGHRGEVVATRRRARGMSGRQVVGVADGATWRAAAARLIHARDGGGVEVDRARPGREHARPMSLTSSRPPAASGVNEAREELMERPVVNTAGVAPSAHGGRASSWRGLRRGASVRAPATSARRAGRAAWSHVREGGVGVERRRDEGVLEHGQVGEEHARGGDGRRSSGSP